jgi:hypothetical protein
LLFTQSKDFTDLIAALAGPRQTEEDFNKRHTMSHPPEHIPDMEHIDDKPKPVKELKKKEDKLKDKVNKDKDVSDLCGRVMSFVLFCFVFRYQMFMCFQ